VVMLALIFSKLFVKWGMLNEYFSGYRYCQRFGCAPFQR
jgi:hypothetical protein